jgi:hypothetical protein
MVTFDHQRLAFETKMRRDVELGSLELDRGAFDDGELDFEDDFDAD